MSGYPVALTNKSWQKNKGLLAKAKPTGIREALTALEKGFASSAFALDPDKLGTETADPLPFGQKYDQLVKTLDVHAKKLDGLAGEVGKRTSAAEKTFAGNKAVLTELGKLQRELLDFGNSIQPGGKRTTDLTQAVLAAYKKNLVNDRAYLVAMRGGSLAASTHNHIQTLLGDVRKIEASKDIADISKMWKEDGPARTLRTTPNLWDQLLRGSFPKTVNSIYPGKAMDAFNRNLDWINDVGNESGGSATKRVKELAETMPMDRAITKFCLEYSNSLIKYQEFLKPLTKLEGYFKKYVK